MRHAIEHIPNDRADTSEVRGTVTLVFPTVTAAVFACMMMRGILSCLIFRMRCVWPTGIGCALLMAG